MKTLKWSLLVVLAAGVGVSTVMLLMRSPRAQTTDANQATEANQQRPEAERNEPVVHQRAPLAPVLVRKPASVVVQTPHKTDVSVTDITSQPTNMVRVRAGQVLAKVNDRGILLGHLAPLQPGEPEQAMTTEEYESRLNRAIEVELTFQAAAARGVGLTPEQKKRVAGIVQEPQVALQEYRKHGVTWSSATAAQVEFEQRLASALMLQENLVAKEAHVAPASDPSAQARYEQARNEVLSRLRANSNISVSGAEL